jgi:hypothetical protein
MFSVFPNVLFLGLPPSHGVFGIPLQLAGFCVCVIFDMLAQCPLLKSRQTGCGGSLRHKDSGTTL